MATFPGLKALVGRQVIRGGSQARAEGDARKSFAAILKNYEGVVKGLKEMTPAVMLHALRPTYNKSQIYVPKETTDLAASGYLEITNSRGKQRVEIGYAKGGFPKYGIWVHEIATYKHAAPTRYKFLEAALNEDMQSYLPRLQDAYLNGVSADAITGLLVSATGQNYRKPKRKSRKKAKKRFSWGGKRVGAGRKKGSVAEKKPETRADRQASMKAANAARLKELLGKR